MRVLSFIPAFLLAAASFVAAAPAPTPDTSCVSHPPNGNGNDAALQPVISILVTATADLGPLSTQLIALQTDTASCTPDAVSGIVVQITAVVSTCVTSLQAAATVDLTGLDLSTLCSTIYTLLELILTIVNTLVCIVGILGATAVATIQAVICDLLNIILNLLVCLNVYVVVSISGVLGPVIACVKAVVDVCLTIVIGVKVSV